MIKNIVLTALIVFGVVSVAQAVDTNKPVTSNIVLAQDTGDLEPCVGHCPCDPRCPDHVVSNKAKTKNSKVIDKKKTGLN